MIKIIAILFLPIYALSAAPNWVPAEKAPAFDRVMQDSKTYEGILRADYEIVACDFDTDTVKITIKRATLFGDLYENVQAEKCEFNKNHYKITLKPQPRPFPWKEVITTAIVSVLAGWAAGAGIGK